MKKLEYDVVVVGGRVGGSTASLFASKSDVDVLMIEKRQEIGSPVQCAEGVTYNTFETLEIKPSERYIRSRIKGAYINAPDGRRIKYDGDIAEGMVIDRKIFDKELAIESAKAGTDIMVKTTAKDLIIKDQKVCGVIAKHLGETIEISADVVIAADGIESNMARLAGIETHHNPDLICSCAQYEMVGMDVDPGVLEFYFGEKIAPGGYLWIFPKGDGIANVGVGIRSSVETAINYLNKYVSDLDATPVELNIGGVPVSGPIDKTYTDGFLVVGDAAGQVDPITGGGIHPTISCARIAGEIAAEAVQNNDYSSEFLKSYHKKWRDEIGETLDQSVKYRRMADKLNDNDMNALAEFIETQDLEAISKISVLKFVGKHPNLMKLLTELL
ncbi:NAD(P)/FAD-dependent oxidoreductase [Methanobacterium spitsbergense]|uniref:Digeranylgeranylglycerophospholipid reductase n=1 Tax=Methanobacterium spitsbergense TaxID=2874285 RepID=A0A8T5UZ32_9EURY|nr:NAD(P)/FAD-dependent oxidoreductase [Methanobacterium spitsbergense]MBZ2164675.1 NAD(P)/FAD-dependent oxidoreductase [Methanobacterium spitsbergense]